ncbi:MAG: hypothetical protein PVG51_11755 [Desulfosarcina sp.]|jgi:hypothetical protein
MQAATIVKKSIALQQQSFNNLYETTTLIQNCTLWTTAYWLHQMGIDKQSQASLDRCRAMLKPIRDDLKRLINENYAAISHTFNGF